MEIDGMIERKCNQEKRYKFADMNTLSTRRRSMLLVILSILSSISILVSISALTKAEDLTESWKTAEKVWPQPGDKLDAFVDHINMSPSNKYILDNLNTINFFVYLKEGVKNPKIKLKSFYPITKEAFSVDEDPTYPKVKEGQQFALFKFPIFETNTEFPPLGLMSHELIINDDDEIDFNGPDIEVNYKLSNPDLDAPFRDNETCSKSGDVTNFKVDARATQPIKFKLSIIKNKKESIVEAHEYIKNSSREYITLDWTDLQKDWDLSGKYGCDCRCDCCSIYPRPYPSYPDVVV